MTVGRPDPHVLGLSENHPIPFDLNRVVDRGPVGFVVTNKAGVIEWINATLLEWCGYEHSQLVGHRTFQELLSPGGRIYYDTHVRPLVHMQHAANEIALELVCADQRRLPILINASLQIDEETAQETIETFVFDATRRREYEIELLRERQLAERSEARLQVMYDIVSGLAEAETVDDIVSLVTDRASRSMHTAKCAIWLLEAGDRAAARVGPIPESEVKHPVAVDFPEGGLALDQLASGQVVVVTDRHASETSYPLVCHWMAESGLCSAAIAPLFVDGRLHGAVSYGYEEPHTFDEHELRTALALASQTQQGLARARILEAERRNKQQVENLLEFTTLLSAALTLTEVIDAIIDRGQELLGAVGTRVALLDDSGTFVRFVRSGGPGGQLAFDLALDSHSIGCEAIRANRPVVVESREELAELYPESPILDHPSFGRVLSIPLRRGDEVLGAWILADSESSPSEAIDLTMFELFAEQAGQATQRAALHEADALAHTQAHIRNLVSAALNAAATSADVGRAITVQGRAAFDAVALAVFLVDPDHPSTLRLETHSGLDRAVVASAGTIPIDQGLAGLLSGPASPMFLVGSSEYDELIDTAVGTDRRGAAALLPLGVTGHPLGLIVMSFERPDALASTTRVALSGMAAEANVALVRARRYDVDHGVATTLQRSLLPSVGPVGNQWAVTTSHEPWSELLEVGGDLFDVTPFDDGRLVLIVGDVVGHGLEAAAAMGLLRSAAKTLALVTDSPAAVIEGLHAFAKVTPGVLYASVCCVEVKPDGTGRYASAGHPFPVLRDRDGDTQVLDGGRSPLLGVGDATPPNAEFDMDVGSSVVVYTDGLIERRGEELNAGIERLRRHLTGLGDACGEVSAEDIVGAMFDNQTPEDDVVAVCITRRAMELPG